MLTASFQRASGILLHPTSLPARGGVGDLGPAAYEFLDFLSAARQSLWQVLPLGPLGIGNSPYSATSAFAGNPLLISLERLAERGWIARSQLRGLPPATGPVDYERGRAKKFPLLRAAAQKFLRVAAPSDRERYQRFRAENATWLEDFALFDALREGNAGASWNRWPRELARREPEALACARADRAAEIEVICVLQFAFFEQWRALRDAARIRGVRIVGDLAIFLSYDSADVWAHPDLFWLNDNLEPRVVAGVPPDAFSATGQRWGNPLYRWDAMAAHGFTWWVERVRAALKTCDILRLDHFRGFDKYWEIPASEPSAVDGRWVAGPGDAFFEALRRNLGDVPLIAEDLGYITPEVHALRQRWGLPGMRILQFAFDNPGAHIYLPHRYETNTVVYTGTHDNDTLRGWWENGASAEIRRQAQAYLGRDAEGMHWAFIRAALDSPASLCIVPLQDVLGLGSEARMNIPSRPEGNWTWRFEAQALKPELAERLALMSEVADRNTELSQGSSAASSETYSA
ncbi:MAG: 4-alpha-glucanotransferase [Acidobacteria bacterium]|nr:4-alpha-glucanotransferase [Acidobacteriota bacterium]